MKSLNESTHNFQSYHWRPLTIIYLVAHPLERSGSLGKDLRPWRLPLVSSEDIAMPCLAAAAAPLYLLPLPRTSHSAALALAEENTMNVWKRGKRALKKKFITGSVKVIDTKRITSYTARSATVAARGPCIAASSHASHRKRSAQGASSLAAALRNPRRRLYAAPHASRSAPSSSCRRNTTMLAMLYRRCADCMEGFLWSQGYILASMTHEDGTAGPDVSGATSINRGAFARYSDAPLGSLLPSLLP